MCGRVRLSSDVSEIKLVFSVPPDRPTPNIAPSCNMAPTGPLPVVRFDPTAGERSLDVMRWGLVPFWAKDIKVGFANINAKAEGIEGKPAFRKAFQWRRCHVRSMSFTSGRRPRPGSNAGTVFESARWPQRNTSGRVGWKRGWARLLRRGRDRSGGRFPNAGYEPHPSCGDCPLTARSRPKRAATISRKIVAGQPYLSGWWKREAELPFTGDQVVCLSHDQAARSGPN